MRAFLLASATAASFGALRLSRSTSQGEGWPGPASLAGSPPWRRHQNARKASSPARVMTPSRVLPAVEWSLGVSPIQAAKCRPERKRADRASSSPPGARRPDRPPVSRRGGGYLIGAMPGHQLGVDLLHRPAAARIRCPARQTTPAPAPAGSRRRDALQQHLDLVQPLGGVISRTPPHSRGSHWPTACAGASSCSRTPISISAACCSAVLTGTKRIVGRLIASHSAAASAASFLPRLTYGFTSCGASSFTSWPSRSARAPSSATHRRPPGRSPSARAWRKTQHLLAPQLLRSTGCSAASTPCSWKKRFDVSIPMRVIFFTDGSLVEISTTSFWHIDAVGGRPPHHAAAAIVETKPSTGIFSQHPPRRMGPGLRRDERNIFEFGLDTISENRNDLPVVTSGIFPHSRSLRGAAGAVHASFGETDRFA